jgi:hypothetical protein
MEEFSNDKIITIASKRGGKKILYKGYAYNLTYTGIERLTWRCREDHCLANLKTNLDMEILSHATHNHSPDEIKNLIEHSNKNITKRALETSEMARDIIFEAYKNFTNEQLDRSPDFESITTQIKRLRNKRHLMITPELSDIPESIRTLANGDLFLQYDSGIKDNDRVVIFCTNENLINFEKVKTILMDGTFKYAPSNFKQLYSLFAFLNGVYVPLIFVLMVKKNEISYRKICLYIRENAPSFCPDHFILDFESAPRKVFKIFFPHARFYGCIFHLSQIVWRKIQELKLSTLYNSSIQFKIGIRMLLSLSFVRYDKVSMYFDLLREHLNREPNKESYEDILMFYQKNYIRIPEEDLIFWNVHDRVLLCLPKTTNCLEGFHRSLNNLFIKCNPGLGYFGERMHQQHLFSRKKILKAYKPKFISSSKKIKTPKEKELYEIIEKFEAIEPLEFLYQVSLAFHCPFR